MKKYNIFLEGIPGSGKSTLLNNLSNRLTDYAVCKEGDISPVELAWCSYMTQKQYEEACEKFSELREEMESHMVKENQNFIVEYTQIRTENFAFYQYMEQYEIYSGRRNEQVIFTGFTWL